MSELPTFTDEKLGEYLGVWDKLIERGHRKLLDITVTMECGCFAWPFTQRHTLAYGEEKRALTYAQACRVLDWMIARRGRQS